MDRSTLKEAMRLMGAKGGKTRAKVLSAAKRKAIAKKAAAASAKVRSKKARAKKRAATGSRP